jgi:hypothetical protein
MLYTQVYVQYEVRILCDFCGWWMVIVVPEIVEASKEFAFFYTFSDKII